MITRSAFLYAAKHPRAALRARPLRLQPPFFSPGRECRRILSRHERLVSTGGDSLFAWQTHQPVLVELLRIIGAPRVLELGIGYASTPLVLGLSASSVSLETTPRWHARFARFADEDHRILIVEPDWRTPFLDEEWDVVFVDNSPAEMRQPLVERLARRARFLICHDTEELFKPSAANYGWDFGQFPHVWTYTQFPTYTTVVSMIEPIPLADRLEGIAAGAAGRAPN